MTGKNKKGFLRIVEAAVGVLIVLSALLIIASQKSVEIGESLDETIPPVLEELAHNETLRDEIVFSYDLNKKYDEPPNDEIIYDIETFVSGRITNPRFGLNARVCALEEICFLEPFPPDSEGELFVAERVISTTVKNPNFEPKKVRVFLWRKT